MKEVKFKITDNQYAALELDYDDVNQLSHQFAAGRAENILTTMFNNALKAALADDSVKTIPADRDVIIADALKARQKEKADRIKGRKALAAKQAREKKTRDAEQAREKKTRDAEQAREKKTRDAEQARNAKKRQAEAKKATDKP